ncbi:ankyrin repeat domain-containing protein [Hydrogenophaga sp. H7]|uniref:ankyrin repeat domain-containing protein n=1 Tax=Hydrogenophaga sp. H7 TaxID=1882399 RepID=UPI001C4E2DD3|nr:ankyrin repeat domain-containing protein [Hydrogenophaga sp. H7]
MNFTAWQIDRLRRGLNAYRLMKATGSAPLPWKTVLDHILRSEHTRHKVPKDGAKEGAFRQEALRRFGTGQETLQPDKLEDVRKFLVAKRVLRPDELDQIDDFREAITLQSVLGSRTLQGDLILSNLESGYRTVNVGSFEEEHIELRFLAEPADNLVPVEERVRHVLTHYDRQTKDREKLGITTRRGYAFMSSPAATLHIFVRGGDLDDHVHYVSVGDALGTQPGLFLPRLLRSRPIARISHRDAANSAEALKRAGLSGFLPQPLEEEQIQRVMAAFNIVSFTLAERSHPLRIPGPSPVAVAATEARPEASSPSREIEPADEAAGTSRFTRWLNGTRLREMVQAMAADEAASLLAEGADVNVADDHGMTALHHAAVRGARPCIRLLVGSGQCDYLIRDKQGRYPFELAIEWARDYAVARLLMKKQVQQAHRQGVPAYVPRAAAQP